MSSELVYYYREASKGGGASSKQQPIAGQHTAKKQLSAVEAAGRKLIVMRLRTDDVIHKVCISIIFGVQQLLLSLSDELSDLIEEMNILRIRSLDST